MAQAEWVEEHYSKLSLEEKIGQLIMVMARSDQKQAETDFQEALIRKGSIGGLIFSKGGPVRQARLTNQFQSIAKLPLLVAMDAEWGLAMRLDSTYAFPWNMTLGAIEDKTIVQEVGRQIAKHCQRLGVHMNFSPVADVNNNSKNPIIGNRSFGEHPKNVTSSALAMMQGLHDNGVLTSAKHFPGHGDTATDSHKALPFLDLTKERLDSIELYPFKELIDSGVKSVMVAHLNIPAYELTEGLPSSLSKSIITQLLKQQLGFKGLVFTDALNMKAVSKFAAPVKLLWQPF